MEKFICCQIQHWLKIVTRSKFASIILIWILILNNTSCASATFQPSLVFRILLISALALVFLFASMPNKTAALSGAYTEKYSIPAYVLQRTATPTATAVITPATSISATSGYSFTLAEQDYKEVALLSPYGNTRYTFRIPEHWLILQDGVFNLDFS